MADTCKFSTYGYACGKPAEHGRYLCADHAAATCSSCGKPATHGCDFCGQFVCGAPLCDECTGGTEESKSSGAWGFMNHIHVSKPEFADKHKLAAQEAALAAKDAEIKRIQDLVTSSEQARYQAAGVLVDNDTEISKLRDALENIIREDDTGPMIYEARKNGPSQAIGGSEGKFASIARAALKEKADA